MTFKSTGDLYEKKLNQLFILNWFSNRVRVSGDLQEAANIAVWAVAEAIGFDRVCLWLIDDSDGTRRLAACHSTAGEELSTPLEVSGLEALKLDKSEAFTTSKPLCGIIKGRSGGAEIAVAPLVTYNPENRQLICWKYFGCNDENCPSRNSPLLSCWVIENSCRMLRGSDNMLSRMDICGNCPIYKTNTMGRNFGLICADNHVSKKPITQDDLNSLNLFANSAASLMSNIKNMGKIKKNEHLLDSIIFNMAAGLLVTDLTGKVKMINISGSEILGCDREAIIGKDITLIYPEAAGMLEVKPRIIGDEVEILTPRGAVPVGFNNNHLISRDGNPEGFIIVFRDLSEIKKLQDDLREKERFAAVGKVAAGVAHEIRNPLFGITSVAQIIARETSDENPIRPLVQAMLSETSRLNRLVEDMLLYNRTVKLHRQPVDICSLIENVLEFHFVAISEKSLNVVRKCSGIEMAMIDLNQIRQVFLNLLINAIDASHEGGRMGISASRSDDTIKIAISDQGAGIPEADLPKVFDLFFTTKEKGTGIGLAICRKIIEDHGGTIAVKSLLGQGTSVNIDIPYIPVTPERT